MSDRSLSDEKTLQAMQKAAVQSTVLGATGFYFRQKPKHYYLEWLTNRKFVPRGSVQSRLSSSNSREEDRGIVAQYLSMTVSGNLNYTGDSIAQYMSGAIHKDPAVVLDPSFTAGLSPTVAGFVKLLKYCAAEEDIDLEACKYFFPMDSHAFSALSYMSSALLIENSETWHEAIKQAGQEHATEDRNLIYACLTALWHLCFYDSTRIYEDLTDAKKAAPIMSSSDDGVVVSAKKPIPYFEFLGRLPVGSVLTLNDIAIKASMLLSAESAMIISVGKADNLRLYDADEKAESGTCSHSLFVSLLDSIGIFGVKEYKPWYDWFRDRFAGSDRP